MIRLRLHRHYFADTYTIGKLYINDEYFCDTLEDKVRLLPLICPYTPKWQDCQCVEKVKHETAIPYGTYKITLEYSQRFKKILPRLHNVPHFIAILIHSGSHDGHTSGCILVGKNTIKSKLTESKVTMDKLIKILEEESDIEITIE